MDRPERPSSVPTRPPADIVRVVIDPTIVWQAVGIVVVTLALLWAARSTSGLLGMVAISFFFSLALEPGVRALRARYGWRRGAAVGVIYLGGVLVLVLLVFVLVPALQTLAATVADRADEWLAALNAWTSDRFGFPVTTDAVAGRAGEAGELLGDFSRDVFGRVVGIATAGVSLLFSLATIAMFTFYLTADAPRVQRAVLRLFSPAAQERIRWTWDQAIVQTGGYFYSRLILMAVNGTGFFLTMVVVGVPVALAGSLALFGGFVSVFIPAIGTYIGSAVPVLLTLALQGLAPALIVLGYAVVYQQVENYWLSPTISANTMSLNGGVAFGAALAGGAIAGPVGAFVALPVAALITSVIGNYARSYDVVEDVGGDRAATPPVAAS